LSIWLAYRPEAKAFNTPIIVAGIPKATMARAKFGSSAIISIKKLSICILF